MASGKQSGKKLFLFDKMLVPKDFTYTSMFRFCPNKKPIKLVLEYLLVLLLVQSVCGQTVRWGTHKGPSSPLNITFPSANWAADPTSIQKLIDIGGSDLVNSTGGPDSSWTKGDRVELGFFASSFGGDGNPGGGDDTASSNMFEGTWVPLTIETYIGQDWGDGTPTNEIVGAGEFAFVTSFTPSFGSTPPWQDYAEHNVNGDSAFIIENGDGDEQTILPNLLGDMDSNTKLGIRFYDSTGKTNETTRYNTIMNNSWTWDPNGVTEMYLHSSTSPHALDTNLVFEFDNSDYASVSKTGSAGVNDQSSDFVTTITYWTGLSALDITSTNENTVLSGITGSSSITGGSDNILTINANGAGTTSNAYSFAGDILDNGNGNGGLQVVKTGTGTQTFTGNIVLDNDADSFLNIHEGRLILDSGTNNVTSEYLDGESGTTLELKSMENASGGSGVVLGFVNTTTAKEFEGDIEITGTQANLKVASGTASGDYAKEQILSGELSVASISDPYLQKHGVGKLRLTGASSTFDGTIFNFDGTLIIGDGVDGDAAFHTDAGFRIEKGKLEIAENESISNGVQGSLDDLTVKSMVGGKGTLDAVKIGNETASDGEITVVSPGHGISSSLSSASSQQQVSLANGTDSIGTFTVTALELNDGGIYDWEISDFDGSEGADWDVLAFDTLTFEGGQAFDLNIFSLQSDGTAGMNSGNTFAAKTGASGFKFLDGPGHGAITWGGFGSQSAGAVDNLFDINQLGWSHYNHHYGNWGVHYDGAGDFYLTYSAVPEPSTYVMVTGLLMLPGYNFVRRLRKKKSTATSEDEEEII